MKPLVIAGHSLANEGGDDDVQTVALEGGGDVVTLTGAIGKPYWDALAVEAKSRTPAILWRGDQHYERFLVELFPPIDFVLSAAPTLPLDPRAFYVAEAQLRALFAPSLEGLAALIGRLAKAGADRVAVCGTPPPIGEVDAVRARSPDLATETNLTSPYTMQKLWSLVQAMTAETAVAAGASFVPVPDAVRAGDGFLAPECWGETLMRPNAAYLRLVADDLLSDTELP